MFVESQLLYPQRGPVPEKEYLVPLGMADIKRPETDLTIVGWGPAVADALKAAQRLQAELGVSAEVVDVRSLVPLDVDTIVASVKKTGRCVVASHAVTIGSFMGQIVSVIQETAFDYLDGPVQRVGAKNGIAPQSHILEAAFLPSADDIVAAARSLL
jgi:pyruvate/2-oxoglutarate/acetoin dehydrogenase E1 component